MLELGSSEEEASTLTTTTAQIVPSGNTAINVDQQSVSRHLN